jgi:hypothetical protein
MRQSIMLVVAALLCGTAPVRAAVQAEAPAPQSDAVAEVQVDGTRHPELKPYRVMSAGLDAFDKNRSRAPEATLKFRLWQRNLPIGDAQKWDGVTLRLAGDQLSIPVPIDADGTFTLPRSQAAYDEDADLVLNRKKSTISFYSIVRSPGFADNVRRLGDLRLQCQVQIAIVRDELNFAQRAFYNTVFLGGDWCFAKQAKFGLVLENWAMRATVDDKGSHKTLPVNGYSFTTPVQDKSLSDDALITLEYWKTASEERKREFLASTPLFVKSSVNRWGAGAPMREVEKGRYVGRIELPRGESKLRLESADGQLALGGAVRDAEVGLGPVSGLRYHGGRMVIRADEPGSYEVSLDLRDPDHPALTINRVAS